MADDITKAELQTCLPDTPDNECYCAIHPRSYHVCTPEESQNWKGPSTHVMQQATLYPYTAQHFSRRNQPTLGENYGTIYHNH
ncbi:hypothetical protein J6590_037733 [Homalodisca vitripennis]|nr:hypothetical protein J6590_037733 [Homalodisca vitripennis]